MQSLWNVIVEGHDEGAQVRVVVPVAKEDRRGHLVDWRGPAVMVLGFPTLEHAKEIAAQIDFGAVLEDETIPDWLRQHSMDEQIEPPLSLDEIGPLTRDRADLWLDWLDDCTGGLWLMGGAVSGYRLKDTRLDNIYTEEERDLFGQTFCAALRDKERVAQWCQENSVVPTLSIEELVEAAGALGEPENAGRHAQTFAFLHHIHDTEWAEQVAERRRWTDEERAMLATWSEEERELAILVKQGKTVVISQSVNGPHTNLLKWSEARGSHSYIARRNHYQGLPQSPLANPFSVKKYGREGCIDLYRQHLMSNKELLEIAEDLCGRTLGCWCAPEACHGDVIAELANDQEPTRDPTATEILNQMGKKAKKGLAA